MTFKELLDELLNGVERPENSLCRKGLMKTLNVRRCKSIDLGIGRETSLSGPKFAQCIFNRARSLGPDIKAILQKKLSAGSAQRMDRLGTQFLL